MDAAGADVHAKLLLGLQRSLSLLTMLIPRQAFVDQFRKPDVQNQLRDTTSIKKYLRGTIDVCHESIKEGKESIWEAGTTTLCGGVICKVPAFYNLL